MGGAAKARGADVKHMLGSSVGIGLNLAVPKSQHRPALSFEDSCSRIIACNRVGVLATIQFNGQLGFATGEVNNVGANDQLAGEARLVVP